MNPQGSAVESPQMHLVHPPPLGVVLTITTRNMALRRQPALYDAYPAHGNAKLHRTFWLNSWFQGCEGALERDLVSEILRFWATFKLVAERIFATATINLGAAKVCEVSRRVASEGGWMKFLVRGAGEAERGPPTLSGPWRPQAILWMYENMGPNLRKFASQYTAIRVPRRLDRTLIFIIDFARGGKLYVALEILLYPASSPIAQSFINRKLRLPRW
ncbi:hypothetical protein DFH11DRAFT_1547916 [Phellopilus nigrolimitatus]|nr:hypothetical protein DFH11DRAFT_1547916 [Phellopilus nigrolimitatus]